MNWLAQNWLWIMVIVVAAYLVFGNHHRGWRGYRNHGYPGSSGSRDNEHGSHGMGEGSSAPSQHPNPAASAIDPVTRKDVATATALTSVYQGRIYYFETAENRQRFEASPEQYAREGLGQSLGPVGGSVEPHRHRRHGGCC